MPCEVVNGCLNKDYILIRQTDRIALTWHYFVEFMKKCTILKFLVDVVHDFGSALQPDVDRGFLHVSNVFLFRPATTLVYGVFQFPLSSWPDTEMESSGPGSQFALPVAS